MYGTVLVTKPTFKPSRYALVFRTLQNAQGKHYPHTMFISIRPSFQAVISIEKP